MIIESTEGNVVKSCFASPAFQLLYSRILLTIKHLTSIIQPDNSVYLMSESDFMPLDQKILTDADFINPATKVISSEQTEGSYPAYTYILATKVKDIIPNWETMTKEEVGEVLVYNAVKDQVEGIVVANNWHVRD